MGAKQKKNIQKNGNDWKNEDVILRAVVLAESFNQRFLPITHEQPRTMLNLFNNKIIDFTFKCLIDSGVCEILVIVCSHAEIIEQHIATSELLEQKPSINVMVATVAKGICDSVGDVMRELDQNYKHIVSQDFFLLTGFMVSTVNLSDLMKQHKEYKKLHKNNIMTVVLREFTLLHRNSEFETTYFTMVDSTTNKLIYMRKFCNLNEGIPYNYFQFNKKLEAHSNLHPTGVYICSPIVPQLFVDNFDFQGMNCLINSVLNRDQILFDFTINYIALKNNVYISNINTLNGYYNTVMDLINRWSYPLTLESLGYKLHKNLVYFGKGCILNRTIHEPIKMVVDRNTIIGADSHIQRSYIGANCFIGDNVTILDSIIWNNVTIGNNSIINNSFIADGTTIEEYVHVLAGSIISFNCHIPSRVDIPEHTCLMVKNITITDLVDMPCDTKSSTKIFRIPDNLKIYYMWGSCKQPFNVVCREYFQKQLIMEDSLSDNSENDFNDDQAKFSNEVHDSILFGIRDCLPTEAIILEINASKHAYNIPIEEMLVCIVPTCLNIVLNVETCDTLINDDTISSMRIKSTPPTNDELILSNYKRIYPTIKELLQNYAGEDELQRSILDIIENYFYQCSLIPEKKNVLKYYLKFVHDLYDSDVLDDYNIIEWNRATREILLKSTKQSNGESILKVRQNNLGKLIEWLQEASEESNDSATDDN